MSYHCLYLILCFESAYGGLTPACSADYFNLSLRNLVCNIDLGYQCRI